MSEAELAKWRQARRLTPWGFAAVGVLVLAASCYFCHLLGFDRWDDTFLFTYLGLMAPLFAWWGIYMWRAQERRYQSSLNTGSPGPDALH